MSTHLNEAELERSREALGRLRLALHKVLFGQEELIEQVLTGVLSRGHLLLEGLPGVGKTALVKGLSKALGLESQRVQFTPDLLPGDITGNPILQEVGGRREFVFQKGPLFANIVLADEINRASPKTQSALLEAMQEGSVTVMGESHRLPEPFFVLATQNPIELEGTYPLPEAQLDRFLFKVEVSRIPVEVLERIVAQREIGKDAEVEQVMSRDELCEMITLARRVYLPQVVMNYIARLVHATHPGDSELTRMVRYGASPRAALALAAAARSRALLAGRLNASFDDVKAVAYPVLCHRLVLDYSAQLEGKKVADILGQLLADIRVQNVAEPSTLEAAKVR